MTLQELCEKLMKYQSNVQLTTGHMDASGGYGWHCLYCLTVIKCIPYCLKCAKKDGGKGDYQNYRGEKHNSNCQHGVRYENIFFESGINLEQIILNAYNSVCNSVTTN